MYNITNCYKVSLFSQEYNLCVSVIETLVDYSFLQEEKYGETDI